MGRNSKYSSVQFRRITPVQGMREFLGDSGFRLVMLVSLLFAFLHQRVIGSELEYGSGGLWCSLGTPAALCLAISVLLAFFGAKAKILPALVPLIGLGGIVTALVMFFVITVRRMSMADNLLGTLQEISMLAFYASWILCAMRLLLTGIGLRVAPYTGVPAAVTTITALILFIIRAMYIFSSLVTALSRNLLLPDDEMAAEIRWVLRSVQPGGEEALAVYNGRLLDSIGIALLLLSCVPLALSFRSFFEEQAVLMKNAGDIPMPEQRRAIYDGYDEYTEDIPAPAEEKNFTVTTEGYYVEKKVTDRAKFKRRERSEDAGERPLRDTAPQEVFPEEEQEKEPADDTAEYYDDYVPGEGWSSFVQRFAPRENTEQTESSAADSSSDERKRVKPVAASKPVIDPNDPDFWNHYTD